MAVNYPSMFDVRADMDRQIVDDAYKAGQLPLGGGMMYASSMAGDMYGQGLQQLSGMLGGTPDPRIAKQQALEEVQQQFPNPETFEDFMDLANALRGAGLYDYAEQAVGWAKDLTDAYRAETGRINAESTSNKAPERNEVDYVKNVNGKDVVYTKTMQWNSSTQTWDFVNEAPKYAPAKQTATMSDMMAAAKIVVNSDGTTGCNLDDPECWIKATEIYHTTVGKETAFDKEFGKIAGADVSEAYSTARKSAETITTIDSAFNALNSGDPIVGFASDMRLGLAKMIGVLTGDDNKDIQATEVWMATTGKLVAELLGSGVLGSGTGLSDNDVKFAKAMVGGDVTLDEDSIRRILYIRRQLENAKILKWNETYGSYPKKVKDQMKQYYTEEQIYQAEKTWDENTVYMKAPKGHIRQQNEAGDVRVLWPASPYDVDVIEYNGQRWTVHDKNGFDITPKQGN